MNRETVNKIRYFLEEVIPPALHDSRPMVWLYRLKWGQLIDELADFRRKAPFISKEEYKALYENYPRIMDETDNSARCIELICENLLPGSVCDIGCGTGHLLKEIQKKRVDVGSLTGVDFVIPPAIEQPEGVKFVAAEIEALPFEDNAFDTVVCTHVLEHIIDFQAGLEELRRVAARRVIIVVPLEREHLYTFNPHLHFFPFPHSFLRVVRPPDNNFYIKQVQRDIFYYEEQT